ncbi:MAG: TonB-dependent receptor [Lacunisphaera sp.]|nr:TonB-dependent receptor [Lacunisphaera sp.]
MISTKLSLFIFLFGAASLGAQSPTGPSPDPVMQLDKFIVSGSTLTRHGADTAQAVTLLSGPALAQLQQPSLGETLASLPGVSSTYFGPGASRPLIRGLGGDRVRILENGVGTLDASVASPDHAVSVEPFLVESVEVVHGPASLLYGSSAIGGVVNVLTHRIEREWPDRTVSGLLEVRHGSAADELAAGGVVDLALRRTPARAFMLHLDGFKRRAEDVAISGFALSGSARADEAAAALAAGEPAPVFAQGTLPNTALTAQGGAAGLSVVGREGFAGVAYSGLGTIYGVPGSDVQIDLRQNRLDLQAETTAAWGPFTGARFKFGHGHYQHVEIEDGAAGTRFTNDGFDARAELLHADLGGLAGAWGVQAGRSDLAAQGDEAFLPPTRTANAALFAFEEFKAGVWQHQLGGRVEQQTVTVRDGSGRSRRERTAGFSAGTIRKISAAWSLAGSITHTARAPSAQELYADGPHAGTGAYEIGDAGLGRERSLGAEIALRRRSGRITGELTLFVNQFEGFIYEQATGRQAVERGGAFLLLDPAQILPDEAPLTVYQYAQTGAKFHGVEFQCTAHLHEGESHQLDLNFSADVTRATDDAGQPLPRIPAARGTVGLEWRSGRWSAGADCQCVAAQRRTAAAESATDGYNLISAHVAWQWVSGRNTWDLFVRGTNLADAEARAHTSFLKQVAPLPGRNVSAGVRWVF